MKGYTCGELENERHWVRLGVLLDQSAYFFWNCRYKKSIIPERNEENDIKIFSHIGPGKIKNITPLKLFLSVMK